MDHEALVRAQVTERAFVSIGPSHSQLIHDCRRAEPEVYLRRILRNVVRAGAHWPNLPGFSSPYTNDGTESVSYQSFRGKFLAPVDKGARAVDNRGESLSRYVFKFDAPPEGGIREATIPPGETVEDVLVFAPPEAGFRSLDLFLQPEKLDHGGETMRLVIPASYVEKPESYNK